MHLYDIVYLIGNILLVYTVYKYILSFYVEKKIPNIAEISIYILYFLVLSGVYLLIQIPIITFFTNLLFIFLCTQIYVGKLAKSLFIIFTLVLSQICIETLVVFLTSYMNNDPLLPYQYESSLGLILVRIISYIFVLVINGFNNRKKDQSIPSTYLVSLIVIPFCTLMMLINVFISNNTSNAIIVSCIICAIAINILTFHLYDKVSSLLFKQMKDRLTIEQSKYYEQQLLMMKDSLNQMKILRHDMNNKLSPLLLFAKEGNSDKVISHLSELLQYTQNDIKYANTGNDIVDSILNYKLKNCNNYNISISTNITIPNDLPMESFDMAIILGTIMDNALEAVLSTENRFIVINISYSKGRLIIDITNSFDGIVHISNNKIITKKKDKSKHGFGLQSLNSTIQKYDGLLQLTHHDNEFNTKLLIYI